ncbi:hypothetical protein ACQJBY_060849 [Aegilops geniculata]
MEDAEGKPTVIIREYSPSTDRAGTEAVDRECEVGQPGGMSLHADLLGDPVARIRNSPAYLMLVSAHCLSAPACCLGAQLQLHVARAGRRAAS